MQRMQNLNINYFIIKNLNSYSENLAVKLRNILCLECYLPILDVLSTSDVRSFNCTLSSFNWSGTSVELPSAFVKDNFSSDD